MVCVLHRIFCRSASIPAYNVLSVASFSDVANNLVNYLFVPCVARVFLRIVCTVFGCFFFVGFAGIVSDLCVLTSLVSPLHFV